jgi:predicted O-methyltransferase YrrM
LILSYFKHLFRAGDEHSVHSPFVFDLYQKVIRGKFGSQEVFDSLTKLRKVLRSSDKEIEILDLGAGSRINKSNRRKISQIAKNAEKPEKFGRLFYRLCQRFQPRVVIELGTSLGLTTLYFAKALESGKIYTFEGCPETSKIAAENFTGAGASNIEIVTGNIDSTLKRRLSQLEEQVDMVYFDANHRYEPTVRYFRECFPYAHEGSVFIFDDIYWSEEMTKAWEEIKADPRVTVTIDLFWIGLVFFRPGQVKEDFVLRF